MAVQGRHVCATVAALATVAAVAESRRHESKSRGQEAPLLFHQLQSPHQLAQLFLSKGSQLHCASTGYGGLHISRGDLILRRNHDIHEDYTIQGNLGEGGFGQVSVGVHKRTGTKWAVKSIPKAWTTKEEFEAEVVAMSDLDHPHIVKLREYFEDADNYYLVEEYCRGPDLVDFLNDQDQMSTEKEVSIVMRQCLKSILGCHAHGFIHRDIKLDNFMVSGEDKTVKMIDFGLAARVSNRNLTQKVGTLDYQPPEILLEVQEGYNALVDVWSLGVVMFALLTAELLLPNDLQIKVGGTYEVLDCNGAWWPMKISSKNRDGTYVVAVEDGKGTQLEKVKKENIRFDRELDVKRLLSNPRYIEERLDNDTTLKHRGTSASCRDLLTRMLEHNPHKRITPSEALSHPFIAQHSHERLSGVSVQDRLVGFDKNVVHKMRDFAQAPRLARIVRLAMTHIVSEDDFTEELRQVRQMFRATDTNGDGEISLLELREFLETNGFEIPADFDTLYQACDSTGNHCLTFVEFVAALLPASFIGRRSCSEAFKLLDRNHNGVIDAQDLEFLLKSSKYKASELEEIVDEAERNVRGPGGTMKGTLDFADFYFFMCGKELVMKRKKSSDDALKK